MRSGADEVLPVELPQRLGPAGWLGLSGVFLAEALLMPDSWGWPWIVAGLVCHVAAVYNSGDPDAVP